MKPLSAHTCFNSSCPPGSPSSPRASAILTRARGTFSAASASLIAGVASTPCPLEASSLLEISRQNWCSLGHEARHLRLDLYCARVGGPQTEQALRCQPGVRELVGQRCAGPLRMTRQE